MDEFDERQHVLQARQTLGRRQAQRLGDKRRIDAGLHLRQNPLVPGWLSAFHGVSIPYRSKSCAAAAVR